MGRLRYACLMMFYATSAFLTYRITRLPWAGPPDWPVVDVLVLVSQGLFLYAACVIDAKVRRHPLSDGVMLVMFVTGGISTAIYLIWSRGWRGVLWLMIFLVALFSVGFFAGSLANTVSQQQYLQGQ